MEKAKSEILACHTEEGLRHLYRKHAKLGREIYDLVLDRKSQLNSVENHLADKHSIIQTTKTSENGTNNKQQSTGDGGDIPKDQ